MLTTLLNKFVKSTALAAAWILASSHAVADTVGSEAVKINVYVTVDWEGGSLDNDNLEAIQDFRKKNPQIAMLHLITPSYWVRPDVDKTAITTQVKSTFLANDKVGLHIHAWKSLVDYCQVPYQHSHSFADQDEACEVGDCGYTVSLEYAYSEADLTKLVACSSEILVQNGFDKPTHFRAGGWQFGPKLAAALQANHFTWDSSQIDASLLTTKWHEESGMVKMLRELHPNTTPLSQPFVMNQSLMEYPNNAALADYTNSKQLVSMFNALIQNNKTVMVLGFHQESAANYLRRLDVAIPQMEAAARKANVELTWAKY